MKTHHGKCFCGHIRYIVKGKPSFPHLCHCNMCQHLSGAPVVNWVTFPRSSFQFEQVEPKYHRSSKNTQRGFCPECSTQICALDDGDDNIFITVTTLEEKNDECFVPESESFKECAMSWTSSDD